jgi:hypothetical protein
MRPSRWPRRRTAALLAAGLVSLWFLRSSLADVYSEVGDVRFVDHRWLIAILGAEAVTFVATWELNRLALRTERWFDVAVAQLAGNAANNLLPAGGPVGAAVQLRVLSEAGFDLTAAATSLGALSILGAAGLLSLPVVALLFTLTGSGDRALQPVLWLGVGLLIAVLLCGVVFLSRDAPLARVAQLVQWIRDRSLPARRRRPGLVQRVLAERDAIRSEFHHRPVAVGLAAIAKPGGDCLALYLCLVAVGAHPNAAAVLAAFAAANIAGMVPFTPGGFGFVEAGITATLVTTGVSSEHAVFAAALYRLASTWLPVAVGAIAYGSFRYRQAVRQATASGGDTARIHGPRRWLTAAVTIVALALVSPVLARVYRRLPDVLSIAPGWMIAIAFMIAVHFVTAWALYRVVLRTSGWFDVGASQLASNAASHVAPAGSAVGAGLQLRMLALAGFPPSQAATALGATTMLGTVVGYIVLPLVVLVATAFGNSIDSRLVAAMWFAAALLAALLVAIILVSVREEPWRWVASGVNSVRRRFRRPPSTDLAERLINERDLIRAALREHARLVAVLVLAQPLADYGALYLALRGSGAHVTPAAALAAFIVSNIAGLIPFTPGGLGFVEAGLTAVLTVAGATRSAARLAVVTYRLAATWIPTLAGAVALLAFHRRHPPPRSAPTPAPTTASSAVAGGLGRGT